MTVSHELAPTSVPTVARRAVDVLDVLAPREAPDAAPTARETLADRVRTGVAAVRRALADGSLHHHRPGDVPAGVRSRSVDVMRAWAAGAGPEAQRRVCGVCSPTAR